MWRVLVAVALLNAQVVLGEDKAAQEAGASKVEAAQSQQESPKAGEPQKQVVNKPVVSDQALKEAGQETQAAQEVPLHRHPTLLRMLFRNNQVRGTVGLRGHRINPALTKAAQDHANYMARTRDFSHYSNGGPSGRAYRYGFQYGVTENIAYGYPSVEAAFAGWQSSSGHWTNMASRTSDAGFGYAVSPEGTAYWVAVYGNSPVSNEEVAQASATESPDGELKQTGAEEPAPPGTAAAEGSTTQMAPLSTYSGNTGRRRLIFRNR